MRSLNFALQGPEDTYRLGGLLAELTMRRNPGAILLYGDLGAGKTALAGALARRLPGGDGAETSSPSFTICNIYYTAPLTHHFDLYRQPPGLPDEALAESLDDAAVLTLVEWPEHMAAQDFPRDGIAVKLAPGKTETERFVEMTALGLEGAAFLQLFIEKHPFHPLS